MLRCAFVTFGCKVNQYDSQAMRETLAQVGCSEVPAAAEADLYVVNTCCVTAESHRKGLQAIRRIARARPAARIIVTGCSAETHAERLRDLPGVVCVVGNQGKARLADVLAEHGLWPKPAGAAEWPAITRFAGHSRAFVKVEDGCNDFCSYCIVPHVRGRVRSRPPDDVAAEVARLVANGYLEVVLTGIHLGAYGLDWGDEPALASLVRRVLATPGLRRLRLSSLELREVSGELIELVAASPRLCPHFHIPLQSGDDQVLRAMNRRYTAADFLRRLDAIRSRIAEPALTTDVIVGFPGETDEQFRQTLAVCRQAAFSRVHIFPYSDRPGTAAATMPGKRPPAVLRARRDEMKALAADLMAAYHRRFVGRTVEPLVESERDPRTGLLVGYTERYVRTLFPGPDALCGTLVAVRAVAATASGLRAEAPS
ncbi:MAG TPA: tRNA (N(6)-L-threonylcarbamoyladenosine(37)-C(2))-methylthiotransferase MtaB [Planctomycetota bacterium]|nr:tRNA (N(6)-L-threonylcarbamoyladenosine(37)-C(2))-methylthiotransferase MtaB [Planctomycetota bacterium]HRR82071.1 tRNA (N(6)-L-threonylcarbamoyladenosine(37)-C(2))-methylthiotransferase MtaB [Planctomycetota bacterium]